VGAALRILPSAAFRGTGFDEALYVSYVKTLDREGLAAYPEICEAYIQKQIALPSAILPPTRFLYILCGWLWHKVSGHEPQTALRNVSCFFAIASLLIATVFAWRVGGKETAFGVAVLMAFAPTQIHMAQHALIDGVFGAVALTCLWLLWENLKHPGHKGWLAAYLTMLAMMVTTKENAFFAFFALSIVLAGNRWLRFGQAPRALWIAHFLGPILGMVTLFLLAGGPDQFFTIYQLLYAKANNLPYAIQNCDGPWHRYLVDLLLVSPLVTVLAIGGFVALRKSNLPGLFLGLFLTASFLPMVNVQYAMNLRYANMWDMPLRFLAVQQLIALAALAGKKSHLVLAIGLVVIAANEWRQYVVLFVEHPLYELVSEGLLRAQDIVKSPIRR